MAKYTIKNFHVNKIMDDYEVSKWEPDPISTPSAAIQNAVLNPEETSVSKFSKPKTVVTVSVPTKIRHLWLAELSRLDDSHTVKSALQTLQQLSSAKKMPAERIAPFIALLLQTTTIKFIARSPVALVCK